MALSYLREGMTRQATFSLFVRDLPRDRGFLVSAGLEPVLGFLADFEVTEQDARDFASALGRSEQDVQALVGLRFDGEVRAVPKDGSSWPVSRCSRSLLPCLRHRSWRRGC